MTQLSVPTKERQEQINYHNRHPNNVIRLILGLKNETDTDTDNPHTRSARNFKKWIAENILTKDDELCFYVTAIDFSLKNEIVTRYGLIATVKLEPFEKGIILPHEKTFSKVKSERLELFKQCKANYSQIFTLYSGKNIFDSIKDAVSGKEPDIDLVDDKGERQRLWRVTDTAIHQSVSAALSEKRLFIADGHHRYETALNYRNWLAENDPEFSENHSANNMMMYLCCMEDPGLIIFAAHRMLNEISDSQLASFIQTAEQYFNIIAIKDKNRAELMDSLTQKTSTNRIGVVIKESDPFYIFELKPGVMENLFVDTIPESLRNLDVTVLTQLIFMKILGFDQARLDNEKLISYNSCADTTIDAVQSGKHDIAFILNPTKMDQVRKVAEDSETMPRKTTYFYPKVITGLVMNKV